MVECANHPQVSAASPCGVCAIDLCAACLVTLHGLRYCGACKLRAIEHDGAELGMETCREAERALWQAVAGLFLFGVVLGPRAIKSALLARQRIQDDARLLGWGKTNAAILLGAIDVVGWSLLLVGRATGG